MLKHHDRKCIINKGLLSDFDFICTSKPIFSTDTILKFYNMQGVRWLPILWDNGLRRIRPLRTKQTYTMSEQDRDQAMDETEDCFSFSIRCLKLEAQTNVSKQATKTKCPSTRYSCYLLALQVITVTRVYVLLLGLNSRGPIPRIPKFPTLDTNTSRIQNTNTSKSLTP